MTTQQQEAWIPEWTFGDRLRRVRRERKVTQGQAAAALSVNEPQIASWESSGGNPRDIVAIAKRCHMAWGVSVEWMLGLDVEAGVTPPDPNPPAQTPSDQLARLTAEKMNRTRRTNTHGYLHFPAHAA